MPAGMDRERDTWKGTENRRKHGVDFADAATVLYDELALTLPGVYRIVLGNEYSRINAKQVGLQFLQP